MEQERKTSLVIADDHPLILAGLAALLQSRGRFIVLGEAGNGLEAVEQYTKHRPDVMLIGSKMPLCNGVEAIQRIRKIDHSARIIILAECGDAGEVCRGLLAGADTYLLKNCELDEVVRRIEHVATINEMAPFPPVAKPLGRSSATCLSRRELEILAHLTSGKSNKLIARAEGIGVGTVKSHVSNILSKLNVTCRTEAASVALQQVLMDSH